MSAVIVPAIVIANRAQTNQLYDTIIVKDIVTCFVLCHLFLSKPFFNGLAAFTKLASYVPILETTWYPPHRENHRFLGNKLAFPCPPNPAK